MTTEAKSEVISAEELEKKKLGRLLKAAHDIEESDEIGDLELTFDAHGRSAVARVGIDDYRTWFRLTIEGRVVIDADFKEDYQTFMRAICLKMHDKQLVEDSNSESYGLAFWNQLGNNNENND